MVFYLFTCVDDDADDDGDGGGGGDDDDDDGAHASYLPLIF